MCTYSILCRPLPIAAMRIPSHMSRTYSWHKCEHSCITFLPRCVLQWGRRVWSPKTPVDPRSMAAFPKCQIVKYIYRSMFRKRSTSSWHDPSGFRVDTLWDPPDGGVFFTGSRGEALPWRVSGGATWWYHVSWSERHRTQWMVEMVPPGSWTADADPWMVERIGVPQCAAKTRVACRNAIVIQILMVIVSCCWLNLYLWCGSFRIEHIVMSLAIRIESLCLVFLSKSDTQMMVIEFLWC